MLQRDNVATGPRLMVARRRLSVAIDASVACWREQRRRARGGCDKRWTASIVESTDASVERSAKMASLDRVCRCDRRWTLPRRTYLTREFLTIGFQWLGHVARVGATDATVQHLSPPKNVQWVSNGSISLWSYK
jgi:hypothetical protein